MKIDRVSDEKAIILPDSTIDISNSHQLKEKLLGLYDQGFTDIIIDFSQVKSIDSSGLGKLLLFHKKLKEKDGRLKIRNINSEYIKKMFKMIHLYKVIDIED